jgi:hypothetical protein
LFLFKQDIAVFKAGKADGKRVKQQAADGAMSVVRSDIYNGGSVSFVPFTKLEGDVIKGTHRAN